MWLFLMVDLQCVIVVFPDHILTHFFIKTISITFSVFLYILTPVLTTVLKHAIKYCEKIMRNLVIIYSDMLKN